MLDMGDASAFILGYLRKKNTHENLDFMIVIIKLHNQLLRKTSSVVHAVVPRLSQQKNKVTDSLAGLVRLRRKISVRSMVTNDGQEGKIKYERRIQPRRSRENKKDYRNR